MSEANFFDEILQFAIDLWPNLVALALVGISTVASIHAIMNKRQPGAAISWSGIIWLSPFFGAALYWIFGVNRIKRRADMLRAGKSLDLSHKVQPRRPLPKDFARPFQEIARYGDRAHQVPLSPGNDVEVLINGDQAYPAMLAAIENSRHYVFLSSYIFDNDAIGDQFVRALNRAQNRGVITAVLVDGTGSRYSFPSIMGKLRRYKITAARFLPNFVPWRMAYLNLRNHRKLLIVDGQMAFTGGMNIREGHQVERVSSKKGIADLHFKVRGRLIHEILKTFVGDWYFTTGEDLQKFLDELDTGEPGSTYARGLADGPDLQQERILGVTLSAIRAARKSIKIVTPYFVPDSTVVQSLTTAAMSGVEVEIIIPKHNNLRIVGYATNAILPDLLQGSCRIFTSPLPFDHSKLMLVDDSWAMFGSSNWDTRSFRLNFEFNVECFDKALNSKLTAIFADKQTKSEELTQAKLDRQGGPIETLRNRFALLFSPYL